MANEKSMQSQPHLQIFRLRKAQTDSFYSARVAL